MATLHVQVQSERCIQAYLSTSLADSSGAGFLSVQIASMSTLEQTGWNALLSLHPSLQTVVLSTTRSSDYEKLCQSTLPTKTWNTVSDVQKTLLEIIQSKSSSTLQTYVEGTRAFVLVTEAEWTRVISLASSSTATLRQWYNHTTHAESCEGSQLSVPSVFTQIQLEPSAGSLQGSLYIRKISDQSRTQVTTTPNPFASATHQLYYVPHGYELSATGLVSPTTQTTATPGAIQSTYPFAHESRQTSYTPVLRLPTETIACRLSTDTGASCPFTIKIQSQYEYDGTASNEYTINACIDHHQCQAAWNSAGNPTGKGIVVGVDEPGYILNHQEYYADGVFKVNHVPQAELGASTSYGSTSDHKTHVAGTIGAVRNARTSNTYNMMGVAFDCHLADLLSSDVSQFTTYGFFRAPLLKSMCINLVNHSWGYMHPRNATTTFSYSTFSRQSPFAKTFFIDRTLDHWKQGLYDWVFVDAVSQSTVTSPVDGSLYYLRCVSKGQILSQDGSFVTSGTSLQQLRVQTATDGVSLGRTTHKRIQWVSNSSYLTVHSSFRDNLYATSNRQLETTSQSNAAMHFWIEPAADGQTVGLVSASSPHYLLHGVSGHGEIACKWVSNTSSTSGPPILLFATGNDADVAGGHFPHLPFFASTYPAQLPGVVDSRAYMSLFLGVVSTERVLTTDKNLFLPDQDHLFLEACYSNRAGRGSLWTVAAIGGDVTLSRGVLSASSGGTSSYSIKNGTSMACPTATGCLAILREKYSSFTNEQCLAQLLMTSDRSKLAIHVRGPSHPPTSDYHFSFHDPATGAAWTDLTTSTAFVPVQVRKGTLYMTAVQGALTMTTTVTTSYILKHGSGYVLHMGSPVHTNYKTHATVGAILVITKATGTTDQFLITYAGKTEYWCVTDSNLVGYVSVLRKRLLADIAAVNSASTWKTLRNTILQTGMNTSGTANASLDTDTYITFAELAPLDHKARDASSPFLAWWGNADTAKDALVGQTIVWDATAYAIKSSPREYLFNLVFGWGAIHMQRATLESTLDTAKIASWLALRETLYTSILEQESGSFSKFETLELPTISVNQSFGTAIADVQLA